jgi:hypothetical protein
MMELVVGQSEFPLLASDRTQKELG